MTIIITQSQEYVCKGAHVVQVNQWPGAEATFSGEETF